MGARVEGVNAGICSPALSRMSAGLMAIWTNVSHLKLPLVVIILTELVRKQRAGSWERGAGSRTERGAGAGGMWWHRHPADVVGVMGRMPMPRFAAGPRVMLDAAAMTLPRARRLPQPALRLRRLLPPPLCTTLTNPQHHNNITNNSRQVLPMS